MPGALQVHFHRPLPEGSRIRSAVLCRDVKGWHVGFAVNVAEAPLRRSGRAVGVDLGITTFAALSDGGFIPSLRAARRAEGRVKVAQRALCRKMRGSNGQKKGRTNVARCHAAIARRRADHLHQASARIVRDYAVIAIEKLNVKGLAQGMLAKDVRDASWGKFISMLRYKAACAGSRLVEVDPNNTSQECSGCGAGVPKGLGDRRHERQDCGLVVERDLNAARNIRNRAGVGPGLPNAAGCCVQA